MASTTPDTPRPFEVTDTDHGAIALIVSTLLMTWSILCLVTRGYMRLATSTSTGPDDIFCAAATTIGTVLTILAGVSVGNGFGRASSLLSDDQILNVQKEQYAVDLLCIAALTLSKCSMVFFHIRITPRGPQRSVSLGLLGVIAALGIASICIVGARCDAHLPWINLTRVCSDYVSGWTAVTVLDVITEILLFAMPTWILFDLQMAVRTKLVILCAFALRLPVIIAAIVHVCLISTWTHSSLPLVAAVTPFVVLQVETHFAIMSTTFPCLGPFMKSVNTRWGTMADEEVRTYAMGSLPHSEGGSKNRSGTKGNLTLGSVADHLRSDGAYNFQIHGSSGAERARTNSGSDSSEQMIIRKTISTSVQHD